MRMNLAVLTRTTVALLFLEGAFVLAEAVAQQSSDMEKVKAASQAFYAALNTTDTAAMEKAWAHTPYVVHISPRAKVIAIGWDAVRKSWEDTNNDTSERKILFTGSSMQIEGNLAWEVGSEKGQITFKNGNVVSIDALSTNIYQKLNGAWLMVSHQAGQIPK